MKWLIVILHDGKIHSIKPLNEKTMQYISASYSSVDRPYPVIMDNLHEHYRYDVGYFEGTGHVTIEKHILGN